MINSKKEYGRSELYDIIKETCEKEGEYECSCPPMKIFCLADSFKPWCIQHLGKLNRGCEYYFTFDEAASDFIDLIRSVK